MTDNVLSFPVKKVEKAKEPVPKVCEMAADHFKDLIILGQNKEGSVQMVTTIHDPAEIFWYFEAARFGIMLGDTDSE
jgi:hypothetical protein|tara:strand:+ start:434 stop:664 length:231 start_codon:yes stop_codon:yes gene_type:complete